MVKVLQKKFLHSEKKGTEQHPQEHYLTVHNTLLLLYTISVPCNSLRKGKKTQWLSVLLGDSKKNSQSAAIPSLANQIHLYQTFEGILRLHFISNQRDRMFQVDDSVPCNSHRKGKKLSRSVFSWVIQKNFSECCHTITS